MRLRFAGSLMWNVQGGQKMLTSYDPLTNLKKKFEEAILLYLVVAFYWIFDIPLDLRFEAEYL